MCLLGYHFAIVHRKEGVEVGYVEEDHEEGEQWGGDADDDEEPELANVRQDGETDAGRAAAQQARETRYARYLSRKQNTQLSNLFWLYYTVF